ncbi:MAG: hypothetical protein ABW091_02780 [Microbacterium sp.]
MTIADWLQHPSRTTANEDLPQADELLDEADAFEEHLIADMLRAGKIEVWT